MRNRIGRPRFNQGPASSIVPSTLSTAAEIPVTPGGGISSTNVQDAIMELDAEKVAKAGDTMTGNLTIARLDPTVELRATTLSNRIVGGTDSNGLRRWLMNVGNSAAESGSNAGSNFTVERYNDAGTLIDAPLSINRATGVTNFTVAPTVAGSPISGGTYTDEQAMDACAAMIQNGTGITWAYDDALNTLTPTVTGGGGVTQSYVDTADGLRVLKAGDTMSGPLVLPIGSATATSANFGAAGTGIYGTATAVSIATSTSNKLTVGGSAVTLAVPLATSNGTVAAPAITFGHTGGGIYGTVSSVSIGLIGANKFTVDDVRITNAVPMLTLAGSATVPAINIGTSGYGMFNGGTDLQFSVNGTSRLTLTATAITSTLPVALPADPASNLHAATKQYVDNKPATDSTKVLKAGDTMTGPLKLPSTGGPSTTSLNFGTNGTGIFGDGTTFGISVGSTQRLAMDMTAIYASVPIQLPGNPSASLQATPKQYVDTNFAVTARGLPAGGTAGQVLSKIDATDYNAQWVAAGGGAAKTAFSANMNGVNQTGIAIATATKVLFSTEIYDVGAAFNPSLSRWTPPAGTILLTAALRTTASMTANMDNWVAIYKNGAMYKRIYVNQGGTSYGYFLSVMDVSNGTDYYELWVFGNSGAAFDLLGNIAYSWFQGVVL